MPDPMKALSIRQPAAEAIVLGKKRIEYRGRPTKVRGRIYIYASLTLYDEQTEAEVLREYGMEGVDVTELPRGVIVGTVELYDCRGKEWMLRNPERAKVLREPTNHPMPVWFTPF